MRAEKVVPQGETHTLLGREAPCPSPLSFGTGPGSPCSISGGLADRSGWLNGPVEAASGGRVDRTGACVGSGAQAVPLGAFIKKGYY
jgi:hypothetical protein